MQRQPFEAKPIEHRAPKDDPHESADGSMAKGGRQVAGNRGDLDKCGLLMEASLRACANRLATFRTWQFPERLHGLTATL